MIKNGRPYTDENGQVDDALITNKNTDELTIVSAWIRENLRKSDEVNESYTSYGLKHELEYDENLYLTNNEFKDAMLLAGFEPVDPNELNWRYRITYLKKDLYNPNPFVEWAKKEYDGKKSEEGELTTDIQCDPNFPVFADEKIIVDYMESQPFYQNVNGTKTFAEMWKKYSKQ